MADDKEWQDRAKGLLKAELAKRNINYKQLAVMLREAYGSADSHLNLSNKIARGKFSAIFMIQVMEAVGCKKLDLQNDEIKR